MERGTLKILLNFALSVLMMILLLLGFLELPAIYKDPKQLENALTGYDVALVLIWFGGMTIPHMVKD